MKKLTSLVLCLLLIVSNISNVFAGTVTLQVAVDSSTYQAGSTVSIVGTLLEDGQAAKNLNPTLSVLDPNGNSVYVSQWDSSEIQDNGMFATFFTLNNDAKLGTYNVTIKAGTQHTAQTNFVVAAPNTENPVQVTVVTNKAEYYTNESVIINGQVTDKGTPVSGAAVTVVFSKDGNQQKVDQVTTNRQGQFTSFIYLNSANTVGTYQVAVQSLGASSSASFNVSVKPETTPPVVVPPIPPPVDVTPPVAPTVSAVVDTDMVLKGNAEAGAKVVAKVNGQVIGEATASAAGAFEMTIAKQTAGVKISVTATDAAGNTSSVTEVTVGGVKVPSAPVVNGVSDADTVISGTAEAGVKVVAAVGGQTIGEATAGPTGGFEISIEKQDAGTKIAVTAVSVSNQASSATEVVVSDKTAPSAPVVDEVKDYNRKVSGAAEPGSTVTVMVGDETLGTATANSRGNFGVMIGKAQEAGTELTVTAADDAGNVSEVATITVIDKTPPKKPIVFTKVSAKTSLVTGKGEANATIIVYAGNKVVGFGKIDENRDFSIRIFKQKVGTVLSFHVRDDARNLSGANKITVK
jgi:5-hydroxyisourate hydrolase-like protein (transthyretin family)